MSKFSIKRLIFVAVSVLAVIGMVSGVTFAAATTKSLSTNFTLVNLSSSAAAVKVDYLVQGTGAAWAGVDPNSKSFTLDPNGGQKQIRQYADNGMSAGSGSAVVSSSQPLAAVVQIQARGQDPTSGAYVGVSKGSDTFYVPLVSRNGYSLSGNFNSQIIIQNAGSSPVNVQIQMKPSPGYTGAPLITIPQSIPAGASYYYDTSDDGNLSNNWFGSAVVTTNPAGGSIAVVSNLFAGADGMQTFNAFAKESLTDKWVAPIFTSRLTNGLSTTVTFQNLSGGQLQAGDVSLDCVKDGESAVSLTKKNPGVLDDFASYSFNPASDNSYPGNWFGACTVTAPTGKKIAVFVQMRYIGVAPIANIAAYEAIPANQQTTAFFVPLIAEHLDNGFATVVNIANLSSQGTNVTLYYNPSTTECPVRICDRTNDGVVNASDAITISNIAINGNAGNQRNHRFGTDLPYGWIGSLKVSTTDGKYIGGIVQLTNINGYKGDTLMGHDAFGQ